MSFLTKLKKHCKVAAVTGCTLAVMGISAGMPQSVQAAGLFDNVLSSAVFYTAVRSQYLSLSRNPEFQTKMMGDLLKESGGKNNDPQINAFVDGIMHNLLDKAVTLPEKRLPFVWSVNNSQEVNACCAISNAVTINTGLITEMNYNQDEIAFVLGHELTHGVKEHTLDSISKQAAIKGAVMPSLLNDDALMKKFALSIAANYMAVKSTTYPNEVEADKGGFEYMTKAGYNPGGGAASMVKIEEYANRKGYKSADNFMNPADHPKNQKRIAMLSKIMTEYSGNKVTIKGDNQIYVNGKQFLIMQDSGSSSAAERTHLIAGRLAKCFHDLGNDWDLKVSSEGHLMAGNYMIMAKGAPEGDAAALCAQLQALLR